MALAAGQFMVDSTGRRILRPSGKAAVIGSDEQCPGCCCPPWPDCITLTLADLEPCADCTPFPPGSTHQPIKIVNVLKTSDVVTISHMGSGYYEWVGSAAWFEYDFAEVDSEDCSDMTGFPFGNGTVFHGVWLNCIDGQLVVDRIESFTLLIGQVPWRIFRRASPANEPLGEPIENGDSACTTTAPIAYSKGAGAITIPDTCP